MRSINKIDLWEGNVHIGTVQYNEEKDECIFWPSSMIEAFDKETMEGVITTIYSMEKWQRS